MTRVGVIGVGKWGVNHLRSLHDLECNIVGISDIDSEKKKIADEFKVSFFEDYHQLLHEVDAVVVTTSSDTHYRIVTDCLQAGKHVLVEKPIAGTSKEGKKLVELAHSKNLILSVGYLYRFNNSIRWLKEIFDEIGRVEYITCRYIHSTKPPRGDSGVILNLGIHVIDILNFVTGQVPCTVCAMKKNLLSPVFEDSASLLFSYDNFFATVELSCMHPAKARDLWVVGEKETIYVDFFAQKIKRFPLQVTYEKVDRKDPFDEIVVMNEPLKEELWYFLDVIEKGDLDGNLGKENYFTTRVCELCVQSAETGKELSAR